MPTVEINRALSSLAELIVANQGRYLDLTQGALALIGIRTRGVPLAKRLQRIIQTQTGVEVPFGELDITLYRDDLSHLAEHPVIKPTTIDFSLDSKVVCLVDDVLFTGRTARCALDALFDLGRPGIVRLCVMVDRGGRELPVQADYVGLSYPAVDGDNIKVRLQEVDGVDEIKVEKHA